MKKIFKFMHNLSKILYSKNKVQLLLFTSKENKKIINIPSQINNNSSNFPELDVLKKITANLKHNKPRLKNYFLVAGQHILNTTGSLLEWIIKELELPAENIYLIGKSYSTAKNVLRSIEKDLQVYCQPNSRQIALGGFCDSYDTDIALLWNKLFIRVLKDIAENKPIDGIFVLDDGGHLFKMIPADLAYLTDLKNNRIPLIGIEQTASGINSSKKFPHPIIEVATSAAKGLEAPMLAKLTEELLHQLESLFFNYNSVYRTKLFNLSKLTFGVVGLGTVGSATIKHLKNMGYSKLIAFDYDDSKRHLYHKEKIYFAKNILEFIEKTDLIFGCTGTDFMNTDKKKLASCINKIEQHHKPYPKILISLSSKDTEFNSLLTHIHQNNRNMHHKNMIINPLKDVIYPEHNPKVIIVSGGTPFNFTKVHKGLTDYSISPKNIQLIRGLLAGAILQAHNMMQNKHNYSELYPGQYKLDPGWQSFIVQAWLESTKQEKNINFQDLEWISRNSGGILWQEVMENRSLKALNM